MESDNNKEELKIEYPCEWSYKIIGNNLEKMIKIIEDTVEKMEYDLTPSNISKKGNYYSLNLKVQVNSETERDIIFKKLSDAEEIIYVL